MKVLTAQEALVCMTEAMQILGNKGGNFKGDDEEEFLQLTQNIKKEIISFLKKNHKLDKENCNFVLNNIIVDPNIAQRFLDAEKETFAETVQYFKEMGFDAFSSYEKIVESAI